MNHEPDPGPHSDLQDMVLAPGGRVPRRIFLESLLIVGAVGLLAGGLVWMRHRGGPGIDPDARQAMVGADLVAEAPTAVASRTPAPEEQPTQALNTPHPEDPPPLEAAGKPAVAAGQSEGETASSAAAPKSMVYEIQNGDTLYGIALDHGVTLDAIIAANNVTDPKGFHVGDKLTIPLAGEAVVPADAAAAAPAADAASAASASQPQPVVVRAQEVYRVQPGDTLEDIAAKHNVTVKDLQAFNPQSEDKAELKTGQEIVIRPAQLATPTALPAGTAIPEQGAPSVAADSNVELLPALRLLGPGADMTVAEEVVLLRWSSAGILPDGLYYVVSLRDVTTEQSKGQTDLAALPDLDMDPDARREWVYSNATALRVPPELRPALGAKRVIEWSVTVRRRGAEGLDGIRSDQAGRETRRFTWVPGAVATDNPTQ